MKINIKDVHNVFRDVLAGRMTREAADRWAYARVQQSAIGELLFSPTSDQNRIWEGVMFLYGVDLMETPEQYLHTDEDIKRAMQTLGENPIEHNEKSLGNL